MIILNKKRLIFINTIIVLSIFFYNFSLKNINNINNSELVSSTPVAGHTVILDAGHGKPDRTELVV